MGTFMAILRSSPLPSAVDTVPLSDRQRTGLAYVRDHGTISSDQYARLVGLAARQAQKDLADMVRQGVLLRVRGSRSTRYILGPGGGVRE